MFIDNAVQLSLDGDTFAEMKKDFDAVLLRTVGNMESKSADEATITLKLAISLRKMEADFGKEPKQITLPRFRHDISSVLQVKDKVSGMLEEDYELIFDEYEGKYVMRRIPSTQLSFFDEWDTEDNKGHSHLKRAEAIVDDFKKSSIDEVIETDDNEKEKPGDIISFPEDEGFNKMLGNYEYNEPDEA